MLMRELPQERLLIADMVGFHYFILFFEYYI